MFLDIKMIHKTSKTCYFRSFFDPNSLKHNSIYLPGQPNDTVGWGGLIWLQRFPEQQCPSIVMSMLSLLPRACGADSCSVLHPYKHIYLFYMVIIRKAKLI